MISFHTRLLARKFLFNYNRYFAHICSNGTSTPKDSKTTKDEEEAELVEQLAEELFQMTGGQKKAQINPDETSALLFPGQGSQYVGMARNLLQYPNVRDMFDVASEILGFKLLDLCLSGPKSELDKTIHCQPATVVTSLAGVEKLQAESPEVLEKCFMTAGYSVGEYAALVFSGALSFEDAINLVKIRATEMQKASEDTGGGMISVIGSARTKFNMACAEAVEYCRETLGMDFVICKVAAYLAPNVRSIAGHRAALEYLESHKSKYHMKRVNFLPVSGAFHTVLMNPAAKKVKSALKNIEVGSPLIKVYSNVDGKPYRGGSDIINKIPDQITRPVLWEQTMHHIFSRSEKTRMPHTYELGPGQQLGALLRKCNGKAWANYLPVDIKEEPTDRKEER